METQRGIYNITVGNSYDSVRIKLKQKVNYLNLGKLGIHKETASKYQNLKVMKGVNALNSYVNKFEVFQCLGKDCCITGKVSVLKLHQYESRILRH